MGRGTGVRLRTWLALLAVFVGGAALWAYGGEAVVVTTTQVGATDGTRHPLAVDASTSPDWGSCAVTDVVVELRGVPDRVVSREQVELCSGDVVVVGRDLEVAVE